MIMMTTKTLRQKLIKRKVMVKTKTMMMMTIRIAAMTTMTITLRRQKAGTAAAAVRSTARMFDGSCGYRARLDRRELFP